MDKRAWVHQIKSQVEKRGADKASWYVSWTDPNGRQCRKSCGPGKVGKSSAERLADKTHSQLVTGTYQANERLTWDQFYAKYEKHIESSYDLPSRSAALLSVRAFVRIVKPKRMLSIDTAKIDEFIAKRRKEFRQRKGADGNPVVVSVATVNRELRYVKSALRLAIDWCFIDKVPRIRFLKPLEKFPTFVTPEHFAAMIEACDVATMPGDLQNGTPAEWWKCLLVTLYMTGWRIGQTLALRWKDIDWEKSTLFTHAEDNKGGRDERIPMHPLIVKFLRPLAADPCSKVFQWNHDSRTLWDEFGRIQQAAKLSNGSPMPKAGKNGGWYGFHDFRRGFASANAASMNLFELQQLMQHKSLSTTQGYVNMANKLNKAVSVLFVPDLGKSQTPAVVSGSDSNVTSGV